MQKSSHDHALLWVGSQENILKFGGLNGTKCENSLMGLNAFASSVHSKSEVAKFALPDV